MKNRKWEELNRYCTGAFRTIPASSLNAEAGMPPPPRNLSLQVDGQPRLLNLTTTWHPESQHSLRNHVAPSDLPKSFHSHIRIALNHQLNKEQIPLLTDYDSDDTIVGDAPAKHKSWSNKIP